LLPRFHRPMNVEAKPDGSLVTSADLAVDRRLRQVLGELSPDLPVLSEEQALAAQEAILSGGRNFWLLDPLDGTTNFAGGMPFFAISLALIGESGVEFGATYDPIRDELFSAACGEGLKMNGTAPPLCRASPRDLAGSTALVDYKRLSPPLAVALATTPPYRSQRNLGACALEWAWLASGRAHLYLHGGQALWDSAAGTLMLTEAGGRHTDLHGERIFGCSLDKPSAVAGRTPELHDQWLRWLTARL
jgi:myo-inositol-1(or 4)-monophosphatase